MKLITLQADGIERIGVLEGESVRVFGAADDKHPTMNELIGYVTGKGWEAANEWLGESRLVPLNSVKILAPIPRPLKNIFCVGKNYREHAKEFHLSGFDATSASSVPDLPIVFSKPATTVIGPLDTIPGHLDPTESVDYENELAVIIGKGGRGISKDKAYEHVFGYTIVNDVTSRKLQNLHKQWFLGKGIDGFCPMGPAILTADSVPDVRTMKLQTFVNGELRQDAVVADLIFDIPTLIETISRTTTLEPGDIIATGTPAGVGIGFTPPKFLIKGDVVKVAIDPIGEMWNTVG
ncbi:fumarylacetoacetate hydrolase family protein [soil metagenome]